MPARNSMTDGVAGSRQLAMLVTGLGRQGVQAAHQEGPGHR